MRFILKDSIEIKELMGHASYSEDIAERLNEHFSELLRVASQVKRGPASEDLSISHEQKLRKILEALAGLLNKLLKNLDDPSLAGKLSTKSLSEDLAQALSKSGHLEATNRALRGEADAAKKHASLRGQALDVARADYDELQASNTRLRKSNKEAKQAITKLQKTLKTVDADHSRKLSGLERELAAYERKVQSLERKNEELESEVWKNSVKDVRPLRKK